MELKIGDKIHVPNIMSKVNPGEVSVPAFDAEVRVTDWSGDEDYCCVKITAVNLTNCPYRDIHPGEYHMFRKSFFDEFGEVINESP